MFFVTILSMCRMFLYDGNLKESHFNKALKEFSKLAKEGCVPCGLEKGHLDGWGIHYSNKEKESYFRSVSPMKEEELQKLSSTFDGKYGQVVIHLRKATIAKNEVYNTHPFLRSGISFCHNGSINAFPESSFVEDRYLREGQTDSETFFLRILNRIKKPISEASLENLKDSLLEENSEIKQTSNWTSLTCFLKSKDGVTLNYLWNENHPDSERMKFDEYYTFYIGKNNNTTILCSEKLNVDGFVWEKLKNGTTVNIPVKSF